MLTSPHKCVVCTHCLSSSTAPGLCLATKVHFSYKEPLVVYVFSTYGPLSYRRTMIQNCANNVFFSIKAGLLYFQLKTKLFSSI